MTDKFPTLSKKQIEDGPVIITGFAQRNVSFFLRIHGHLPDQVCGRDALAPCEYRKDGRPINRRNDYVDKLRESASYRQKEKQVQDAQARGVSIRKQVHT